MLPTYLSVPRYLHPRTAYTINIHTSIFAAFLVPYTTQHSMLDGASGFCKTKRRFLGSAAAGGALYHHAPDSQHRVEVGSTLPIFAQAIEAFLKPSKFRGGNQQASRKALVLPFFNCTSIDRTWSGCV